MTDDAGPDAVKPTATVLEKLSLVNFRNHANSEMDFASGLTVVSGANGEGKTNLLEAIGYLASLASFRGASADTMIGVGNDQAVVRAYLKTDGRDQLIEAQLDRRGRNRIQVNRQPLKRARDLLGTFRVVVFAPDDLAIVKAGPGGRRDVLDVVLGSVHRRHLSDRSDIERVLKQRSSVLKQAGGSANSDVAVTLDVWDAKLVDAGERHVLARERLVEDLAPVVQQLYQSLAGDSTKVSMLYRRSWDGSLLDALARSRVNDLKRRVTLVGPHRDELEFFINGLPARTHGSQGEQRTLALSLRLASQRVIAQRVGCEPVVLLDDVFSELDEHRAAALVRELPAVQTILTTATGTIPAGVSPTAAYVVHDGQIQPKDG